MDLDLGSESPCWKTNRGETDLLLRPGFCGPGARSSWHLPDLARSGQSWFELEQRSNTQRRASPNKQHNERTAKHPHPKHAHTNANQPHNTFQTRLCILVRRNFCFKSSLSSHSFSGRPRLQRVFFTIKDFVFIDYFKFPHAHHVFQL